MNKDLQLCADNSDELVRKVLADNPEYVKIYKAGKGGILGFLVGQVMKLSKGSVNPKTVNELLVKYLNE